MATLSNHGGGYQDLKEALLNILKGYTKKVTISTSCLNTLIGIIGLNKLMETIEFVFVDTLTDFNYSKCFSYFIQSSEGANSTIGSDGFKNYLKEEKEITGVLVLISAIAPYSVVKYV